MSDAQNRVEVYLTDEQLVRLEKLRFKAGYVTSGAVIKRALEYYEEWLGSDER